MPDVALKPLGDVPKNLDKQMWDFLKGDEEYKYHLGGREIKLYHCQVNASRP